MRIRIASRDDVETIVEFQLAMAQETEELELDRDIVTRGVQGVLDDDAKGQYWLAESDNDVVGSLLLTFEWSDWRCGQIVWIQSVFVTPTHRRRGIFRALFHHVQELVEQREDWCGIRLYVDNRNANAQTTYEQLGMDGEHYRVFELFNTD